MSAGLKMGLLRIILYGQNSKITTETVCARNLMLPSPGVARPGFDRRLDHPVWQSGVSEPNRHDCPQASRRSTLAMSIVIIKNDVLE
jgi:hypothetical protein